MSDEKLSNTPEEQQSTGYVPGDDFSNQWGNYFRRRFGRMTEEGALQWKLDRDERNREADCTRCEKHRDYLLMYSTQRLVLDKVA